MANARHWRWSTIEKAMSNIRGALKSITLYTNVDTPIDLNQWPEWTQARLAAGRYTNEQPPQPPPHLPRAAYLVARRFLSRDPTTQLFLALMWALAGRPGDITGLNKEDVHLKRRKGDVYDIAVTMRRGKGSKFRGPYTVPSTLCREDAAELSKLLNGLRNGQRLFPMATRTKSRARAAVAKALPGASLPSVRKGAARHLAEHGMSEEDLAKFMGHTNLETLRKYLGYAENLTVNARRIQAQTVALQSDGHQTQQDETN